jgi:DNA modification methylase
MESRLIKKGDEILANINTCDTLKPLCLRKDHQVNTQQVLATLQKKVTTGSMTLSKTDIDWLTMLYGKKGMERFRKGCKSITGTIKNKTIELKTLSLLVPLTIKGCTQIAELKMENGKKNVRYVKLINQLLKSIGTTQEDGSEVKSVKGALSKKGWKKERFVLQKVGNVRTIREKIKVYNLSIKGIPAFDTLIGVSHNTQKPVELICYAIRNSSKNEDLIVDLFLGSGATMIAAGKKGRICYGMELDPKFIDVIVERYCKYTGTNKVIKNGEEIEWVNYEKEKTPQKKQK